MNRLFIIFLILISITVSAQKITFKGYTLGEKYKEIIAPYFVENNAYLVKTTVGGIKGSLTIDSFDDGTIHSFYFSSIGTVTKDDFTKFILVIEEKYSVDLEVNFNKTDQNGANINGEKGTYVFYGNIYTIEDRQDVEFSILIRDSLFDSKIKELKAKDILKDY